MCALIISVRMTREITEDTAMRHTFFILTLSIVFTLQLSGCSLFSSSSGDDAETATVAVDDDSGGELGTIAEESFASDDWDPQAMAEDGGDAFAESGSDMEVEDNFGFDDAYPDDDYGGATASTEPVSDWGADEDMFAADSGSGLPDSTMQGNQEEDLFASDEPIVDTPAFADSSFDDTFSPAPSMDDGGPKLVPLKKMKESAYSRSGANINRLYIVRDGDTMESVTDKIYGGQRGTEDLYSYNSHFRGKDLKVGDKIYFESPNNPNDQSMKTYYEDVNISPQYYTSQDGDNIRAVAKQLLGHERSWMEIWATNASVESKGEIPGGIQLRYWPDGIDTQMAKAEPAPVQPIMPDPPEEEIIAMDDPEPIDDLGSMDEPAEMAQMDEPSSFDDMSNEDDFNPPPAVGSTAPPAPPKPMAPPAPPAPRMVDKPSMPPAPMAADSGNMMDDDSMIMGALGGLLILAAIIMLIFIRRSRAKRVNFSQTQI
jgi:hypothetical protein